MENAPVNLAQWRSRLKGARLIKVIGQVTRVIGLTVEVQGINAPIGEVCEIMIPGEPDPVRAEIVGFRDGSSLLMPLGELRGIYQAVMLSPRVNRLTSKLGSSCSAGS